MARPSGRRRRPTPSLRPIRWLHQLSDLLSQASLAQQLERGGSDAGVVQRRLKQRISTAQRLLDPLPAGLRHPEAGSERFWRLLRWGGLGLLLGAWLRP